MNTISGTRKDDVYTIIIEATHLKQLCDMNNISRPAPPNRVEQMINSMRKDAIPIHVMASLPKNAVVTYYGDELDITVEDGSIPILDGVVRLIAACIVGNCHITLTIEDPFYRVRKIENLFK